MKQPEKAASETEPESFARLRSEFEGWVIDREFFECITQFAEVLAVAWIQATVDHSLRGCIAFEWFNVFIVQMDDCIADADVFE